MIIIVLFVHASLEEEETAAKHVLDIFHDRVLVAQCRAGCDHRYLGDHHHQMPVSGGHHHHHKMSVSGARGQCWTVCHLLASAPPVWAQICDR